MLKANFGVDIGSFDNTGSLFEFFDELGLFGSQKRDISLAICHQIDCPVITTNAIQYTINNQMLFKINQILTNKSHKNQCLKGLYSKCQKCETLANN